MRQRHHLPIGGDQTARLVQRGPEGNRQIALRAERPPLGNLRLGGNHGPDLLFALPQQRLQLLQEGGPAVGARVHECNEPTVQAGLLIALKGDVELVQKLLDDLGPVLGIPAFEAGIVIEGAEDRIHGVYLLQELPGQSLLLQSGELYGQSAALEAAVDTLLFQTGEELGRGLIVTAVVLGADFGEVSLPHRLPEGGVQTVGAAVVLRLREENLTGELEVKLPEVGALEKILEFFPAGCFKPALCGKGEGGFFFWKCGAGPGGICHRGGGLFQRGICLRGGRYVSGALGLSNRLLHFLDRRPLRRWNR